MTEARLAEIRARHDVDARDPYLDECDNMTREAHADRAALLAEVDRLQAALRQAEGDAADARTAFETKAALYRGLGIGKLAAAMQSHAATCAIVDSVVAKDDETTYGKVRRAAMSDNISRAVAVLQLEAQYTLASEERRGIGYGNQGYAFTDGRCQALAWAIGAIRAIHTTPPAASEVAEAINALEFTRWQPTGDLAVWSKTDDGRNHTRVMHAIGLLRGIVAAPGERGEAVEAHQPMADRVLADPEAYGYVAHTLATALREAERRARAAESDRDALRAERDALRDAVAAPCDKCGHGKSADWKALEAQLTEATARAERAEAELAAAYAAIGDAERAHSLVENIEAQKATVVNALKRLNELHATLTAEREAHEETRRKLEAAETRAAEAQGFVKQLGDAHTRLQSLADERFGYGPTEPVDKLISKIERGIAEMATTEAAPDLAEAVARRVVQRLQAGLGSQAACDAWHQTRGPWEERIAAALSVAIGDLGTGPSVSPEPENRGPIVEAAPPIVAAWLEDSRRFPNSGSRSLEVWLAESIDRLDAEVRRIGGGR